MAELGHFICRVVEDRADQNTDDEGTQCEFRTLLLLRSDKCKGADVENGTDTGADRRFGKGNIDRIKTDENQCHRKTDDAEKHGRDKQVAHHQDCHCSCNQQQHQENIYKGSDGLVPLSDFCD